ncbi:unnamed protein product [Microthlaspi erraticum]|uniref:Protein kinase domain-containing protein n=1 Tax=Microthlaspi erraticum TaxID=1685480 RepID=A0A6D2LGV3_9BRAS|nr:unnamed protein product [Microthlaspi erraticum]
MFILRKRNPSARKAMRPSLEKKSRRFTYSEVKQMTNNFKAVLGGTTTKSSPCKFGTPYCDEGYDLALIYEFMENEDLKEHISGKRGSSILTWPCRLRIAAESALGIEYLHIGCKPK